jgi:ribosome-binding factor A
METAMADVKRAVRVAERVREALALLLAKDARDPRLEGVIVSRVEMPDDLRSAKIYVRTLDPSKKDEALLGLERASGMLRSELTKRVQLRYAPTLRFYYDEALEKQSRIEELLAEVKADVKAEKKR